MLRPGQHIQERYVVEELVGTGGLAEVYRVRHLQLGSVHALKLLLFRKKSLADRLLLEGRIQAQLRHPNVVAVTDVVLHDGQYALLMEYVDNFTLEEIIDSRGAMPVEEALQCIAQVLAGVHAAHKAGVLHRDLKPANVLMARVAGGLVPKVSDFGIAKVLDEGLDGSTRENVAMGTPGYMAPEQVLDARSVDARTDIFALAGMVYELISGRRAFADEHGEVTLKSTLDGTFMPLHEVAEGVPMHISDAVAKGLSRQREDRQADVMALAEELFSAHPALVDLVRGTGHSAPLSLDPGSPSRFSNPGTRTEDESTAGGGPTLLPPPATHAIHPEPTYEGGQVALDNSSVTDRTGARVRRGPPPFWTGAIVGVGLLLFGGTIGLLVAGPALGWFISAEGTAARRGTELDATAEEAIRGTVRIKDSAGAASQADDGSADGGADVDGGGAGSSAAGGGRTGALDGDRPASAIRAPDPATAGQSAGEPSGEATVPEATGIAGDATDGAASADGPDEPASVDGGSADEQSEPGAAQGEGGSPTDGASTAQGTGGDPTASVRQPPDEGTGTAEPAPEATPEPPARPMVMPMETFLASSWNGRVFRQPFTLRVLDERGGDVVAEGKIVLGAQQRILRLTGRYDPWTGALYLKETNGSLILRGTVSAGAINGTFERQGKGSPEPLSLTRR